MGKSGMLCAVHLAHYVSETGDRVMNGLRSQIVQTAKRSCAHAQVMIFFKVGLQVVHVYDGDTGRWVCLCPGAGAAGPAELSNVSIVLSNMPVHECSHSITIAIPGQICI